MSSHVTTWAMGLAAEAGGGGLALDGKTMNFRHIRVRSVRLDNCFACHSAPAQHDAYLMNLESLTTLSR